MLGYLLHNFSYLSVHDCCLSAWCVVCCLCLESHKRRAIEGLQLYGSSCLLFMEFWWLLRWEKYTSDMVDAPRVICATVDDKVVYKSISWSTGARALQVSVLIINGQLIYTFSVKWIWWMSLIRERPDNTGSHWPIYLYNNNPFLCGLSCFVFFRHPCVCARCGLVQACVCVCVCVHSFWEWVVSTIKFKPHGDRDNRC